MNLLKQLFCRHRLGFMPESFEDIGDGKERVIARCFQCGKRRVRNVLAPIVVEMTDEESEVWKPVAALLKAGDYEAAGRVMGRVIEEEELAFDEEHADFERHMREVEAAPDELLKRVRGRYLDPQVQEKWELWKLVGDQTNSL